MSGRLLSTADAAASVFVPVNTLLSWVERGYLAPVAPGVYREEDVADAEARTRRKPRLRRLVELAQAETFHTVKGEDQSAV